MYIHKQCNRYCSYIFINEKCWCSNGIIIVLLFIYLWKIRGWDVKMIFPQLWYSFMWVKKYECIHGLQYDNIMRQRWWWWWLVTITKYISLHFTHSLLKRMKAYYGHLHTTTLLHAPVFHNLVKRAFLLMAIYYFCIFIQNAWNESMM